MLDTDLDFAVKLTFQDILVLSQPVLDDGKAEGELMLHNLITGIEKILELFAVLELIPLFEVGDVKHIRDDWMRDIFLAGRAFALADGSDS